MDILLVRGAQGPEVQALRRILVEKLGADAQAFANLGSGDTLDADVEAAVRRWQSGVGLVADGVVGPYCQVLLGLRPEQPLDQPLTVDTVRKLFPATKPANIARYLPYVLAALAALGLTDRPMVCAALGSIRAETEGFLPISEFQSQFNTAPGGAPFGLYDPGTRVGKNLGNTQAGDGARFKGRGFVQLTGRDNYVRYGKALGVDLTANADLANAPEVAALLLARFLADHAAAMREALASGAYAVARKLVNGGAHGLDRFRDVFNLADAVWSASGSMARAGAGKAVRKSRGKAVPASGGRQLTVRKDPPDLNDRAYLPPPLGLFEAFPPDALIKEFLPAYTRAGLILDQGTEAACTGFGLACVVNYLRWRKAATPENIASVSPRMLYNFARRYDEYDGENYSGSSCRGALKGWFNHGVCLDADWPYGDPQPQYGYAKRASDNTLGVYYRIDLKSITDLQAAIQAVGAVYVSAFTHEGWHQVPNRKTPPKGHQDIPLIPFDGRPSEEDGHAFALVGFNTQGFVVQNSWGTAFGVGGFALLGYADWLANGMDAWVVAMGVPGVVVGRVSVAAAQSNARAGGANTSLWWSEDQAYQHSVVFGNDGRVKRYLTEDELSRTLGHQVCDLPDQWFRSPDGGGGQAVKRLVVYAHGGLNSEDDAIQRARAMGRHFAGNGCYPLFLVWKTGLLESIGDIIRDAFHKQPALAGGVADWVSEKTDLLLEKTIGRPLARPIWSEMKENAELAFGTGRGGELFIKALQKLLATWGDKLEIHLIGHSAGSILLGHMLTALASRGVPTPAITSIHLYAPACTVAFANKHYAMDPEVMARLHLQLLSDRVERNDNVVSIYRKSLLYFVSNALELDLRTPILGMENVYREAYDGWDGSSSTGDTLKDWRRAVSKAGLQKPDRLRVVDTDTVLTAQPDRQIKAGHGSFDNDVDVLTQTLELILHGPLPQVVDDLRGF
ncbi:peptidase C1 [Rhodoferax sp.]|uniref:peptidase C1 n=1 Tax=Rhodoferax sp. TaxID=50421 RepID=UPI00374DD4FA